MDKTLFSKYSTLQQTVVDAECLDIRTKIPKRTSERAEMVKYFVDKLNIRQASEHKKPYAPRFIAIKLSHLSMHDLHYLKSICEDAQNWYKTFWGSLKVNRTIVD